ncbi:bifunctional 4-hydroxy-2-oxoglutarate aldolase/2-dehydro-3-deoxy-phosphogluconate aldolase [Nocardioides hungaricus]
MSKTVSITQLAPQRVLPVLVLRDPADAISLRPALQAGGLTCAEVTLRTSTALAAIELMADDPDFAVGAGTVLTADQARAAAAAGARFMVSPGFSLPVAVACADLNLPYFPGVATPTEISTALAHGLNELKFFPAQALGGVPALKALSAPFGTATFIPTGGITESNCAEYFAIGSVAAVGGTWIATPEILEQGDYDEVTRRAARAVTAADPSLGRFKEGAWTS